MEKLKEILGKAMVHIDRIFDDIGAWTNSDIGVDPIWVGLLLMLLIYFRLGAIRKRLR